MTDKCIRCGSPKGKKIKIGDDTYCVCETCRDIWVETISEVADHFFNLHSDYFIGFKANEASEIGRLLRQSANKDIQNTGRDIELIEEGKE